MEGNYTVTVRGGYVLNRVVSSGTDAVVRVIPEVSIEGVFESLPPEETVELQLTASQAVFVQITTDDRDALDGTNPVQIVVSGSTQSSDQAQPIDDENPSGDDGIYFYPIATLEVDDDDIATVKQVQQGGPIVHDPLLWSGENVGDGKEIYKGRDTPTNRYQFRTIRERASSPQIRVKLEETLGEKADELTVEGNEFDGSLSNAKSVNISVIDGLVTSLSTGSYQDAKDLNLTIQKIVYSTADLSGNDALIIVTGATEEIVLYWRDGLFIGTTDPADAPVGLVQRTVTHLEPYIP